MTGVAVTLLCDDSQTQSMSGVYIHALRTSDTDRRVLLEEKKQPSCAVPLAQQTLDTWLDPYVTLF